MTLPGKLPQSFRSLFPTDVWGGPAQQIPPSSADRLGAALAEFVKLDSNRELKTEKVAGTRPRRKFRDPGRRNTLSWGSCTCPDAPLNNWSLSTREIGQPPCLPSADVVRSKLPLGVPAGPKISPGRASSTQDRLWRETPWQAGAYKIGGPGTRRPPCTGASLSAFPAPSAEWFPPGRKNKHHLSSLEHRTESTGRSTARSRPLTDRRERKPDRRCAGPASPGRDVGDKLSRAG